MKQKRINKKGFTLTELIVVIVIIGILAAVLIPTLTGYISKAKETAAKQEASSYITAFNTWKLENDDEEFNVYNFRDYCVELGLTSDEKAVSDIINVKLDSNNEYFVIKASNGMYVTYESGMLSVTTEHPNFEQIEFMKNFFENVVDKNIKGINDSFTNKQATLGANPINPDGSVDIDVIINEPDEDALSVYTPVTKALEIITSNGGKSCAVTPIVNGKEYTTEEFIVYVENVLKLDSENFYPMTLSSSNIDAIGLWIANVIVFNPNFTADQWNEASGALIEGTLGGLIGKNSVKVVATVETNGVEEEVVYYFNFK